MKDSILFYLGALEGAISRAAVFAGSDKILSNLGDVLISVEKNKAFISTTNLNAVFTEQIMMPETDNKKVQFQVPVKSLLAALLKRDQETVSISLQEEMITLSVGSNIYNMPRSHDIIPLVESSNINNFTEYFEVSGEALKNIVDSIAYAASKDELRPVMNGILISPSFLNSINFVATDAHVLAVASLDMPKERSVNMKDSIVPTKEIVDVVKIIEHKERPIKISKNDTNNWICFSMELIDVYIRLIDGNYPNYEAIIPSIFDKSIGIIGIDKDSIKRMSVFSDDTNGVTFFTKNGKLNLRTYYPENNMMALESFILDEDFGKEIEPIKFSVAYLKNIIDKLSSTIMVMDFISPAKLSAFYSKQDKKEKKDYHYSIKHFLMPMMISDSQESNFDDVVSVETKLEDNKISNEMKVVKKPSKASSRKKKSDSHDDQ